MVAGAKVPLSAELTAKSFKPLISAAPTPERAQALKALTQALDADCSPQPNGLAKALGSHGVLGSVAECLKESPGQESAARCVYFAARADPYAARILVDSSVSTLLLPLLTSPDDSLQQWAAAALVPVLSGDSFRAAKGVVEGGGVFTVVLLLSSTSSDVRFHALAALVALCSAAIEAAWPKSGPASEDSRNLLDRLVNGAVDAGVCRSIIPLLRTRDDVGVAAAALEALIAMSYTSSSFRCALRREIGNDSRITVELVAACSDRGIGSYALRVVADTCYCIDEQTGAEDHSEAAAACNAAKELFAAGALGVAIEALDMEMDTNVDIVSSLLQSAALKGAEDRGYASVNSRRDDGARTIAALMAYAPGAVEECAFNTHVLSTLVSIVVFELAPSLETQESQPRAVAALPALTLCVLAGARRQDAGPAVELAQAGLFELIAKRGFLNVSLVHSLDSAPSRGLVATRVAMLVHECVDACWRDSSDGSNLVLALTAPPDGRLLTRLCELLDGLALSELAFSNMNTSPSSVGPLTTAILLALGSLCGAARPFDQMAHSSEQLCKRDIAQSQGCGLAIAAELSHEPRALQQVKRRRAASRLLAVLLRDDCDTGSISIHQSHDMVALALARAGLVGIAARCLDDEDAIVRADALDAFATLSAYAPCEDRDVASGAAALGDALARGAIASDATTKHAASGMKPSKLVATKAVEKAVHALEAACRLGGVATRNAVASSPSCVGALVSLIRAPLTAPSDFGVRCAGICLFVISTLADGAQGRAITLAGAGACDATTAILVAAIHDKNGHFGGIETAALTTILTLATYPEPRRKFASTITVLVALFQKVAEVQDIPSFERASIAVSALLHFAHPTVAVVEPLTAVNLASAAKRVKAVTALTSALNGGWRAYVTDDAHNDAIMQDARQIITALANAPTGSDDANDDNNPLADNDTDSAYNSYGTYMHTLKDNMLHTKSHFPPAVNDGSQHFEQRYSTWLQKPCVTNKANIPRVALGGADPAALVSLITAPPPLNNAERIAAHISAVDRASMALGTLIAEDVSGSAATVAIQGGALTQLLVLAPRSPAAAMCLVALCKVGELHRPLMLSAPTPAVTIKFIDTIINMLCAIPHGTLHDESDVKIVQASVKLISFACADSDIAVLGLATAFLARGKLSFVVTRLAAVALAETAIESSILDDPDLALPGTFVLVSMLAPRLQDASDDHDDLCGVAYDRITKMQTTLDSAPVPVKSLIEVLAINEAAATTCKQVISPCVEKMGVVFLLDAVALNAVANAAPALFRALSVLPPGGLRARARRAVAAVTTESLLARRCLQGAGAIDVAVKLVVRSKSASGKTATADTALGLTLLASLVDGANGRAAARAALAHDGLLPALAARIVQAASASKIDPLAFAALSLLVNMAYTGDDAAAYIASRNDLLRALVLLARRSTIPTVCQIAKEGVYVDTEHACIKGREHAAAIVKTSRLSERASACAAAEHAVLALANVAVGGPAQRDTIAKIHGVLDASICALRTAKPGAAQAAAAKLTAVILEARNVIELSTIDATATAAALSDTLTTIINVEFDSSVLGAVLHLMRILNALLCYPEGKSALRSPKPTTILAALLNMTATRHLDVAEVCAAQINSLCYDPYHLMRIKYEHVAALTNALKLQEAAGLKLYCLAILNCIAQANRSSVNDVLVNIEAGSALCSLCTSQNFAAAAARRLATSIGTDHAASSSYAEKICKPPDAPTTTAAASIAAALVAL